MYLFTFFKEGLSVDVLFFSFSPFAALFPSTFHIILLLSPWVNRKGREGVGEKGGEDVLDSGAESEASLERIGAEASRAAGGFGSPGSGVGTLSDICLLTAAGAAGWKDWGAGGGGGGEGFGVG